MDLLSNWFQPTLLNFETLICIITTFSLMSEVGGDIQSRVPVN